MPRAAAASDIITWKWEQNTVSDINQVRIILNQVLFVLYN